MYVCIQKKFDFAEKWDLMGVMWLISAKTGFFISGQPQKLKKFQDSQNDPK